MHYCEILLDSLKKLTLLYIKHLTLLENITNTFQVQCYILKEEFHPNYKYRLYQITLIFNKIQNTSICASAVFSNYLGNDTHRICAPSWESQSTL